MPLPFCDVWFSREFFGIAEESCSWITEENADFQKIPEGISRGITEPVSKRFSESILKGRNFKIDCQNNTYIAKPLRIVEGFS